MTARCSGTSEEMQQFIKIFIIIICNSGNVFPLFQGILTRNPDFFFSSFMWDCEHGIIVTAAKMLPKSSQSEEEKQVQVQNGSCLDLSKAESLTHTHKHTQTLFEDVGSNQNGPTLQTHKHTRALFLSNLCVNVGCVSFTAIRLLYADRWSVTFYCWHLLGLIPLPPPPPSWKKHSF